MRRVILSVSFADTFRATLTSVLLALVSLVVLQTQLINSASAEVTFLNTWGSEGSGDGELISCVCRMASAPRTNSHASQRAAKCVCERLRYDDPYH